MIFLPYFVRRVTEALLSNLKTKYHLNESMQYVIVFF